MYLIYPCRCPEAGSMEAVCEPGGPTVKEFS